ncbi:MAG: hypothetical protein L0332_11915 [Chloroflexi bacterium]|nr:hypothetical protein [Chloroflexota bacterium]MCI0727414.1 hypothetical protein [Chloroflexota bacterium]
MRILFYVKSIADAHLAHALAHLIRSRLGKVQFSAVVYRSSSEGHYLREEAGDLFSRVLSESETYDLAAQNGRHPEPDTLTRLEEKYGIPTLWQYVTHDRWLSMQRSGYLFKQGSKYSRDQLLVHIQSRFQAVERLFDDFQPDVVVYAGRDVGPSSALVVSNVAVARGIPLLVPLYVKIASYFTLANTIFSEAPHVKQRYEALRSGQVESSNRERAVEFLNEFRRGGVLPYFLRQKEEAPPSAPSPGPLRKRASGFKAFAGRVRRYYRKSQAGDPLYTSWFKRRYDKVIMAVRQARMSQADYFSFPAEGEKYVFFPLHLEPELSLLLYAPFFTHQFAIIQNVAQSLPHNTCLYVKDHPRALGRRSAQYYREVTAIPNVRLMAPTVKGQDLIRGAEGVITITGTAGLEAILFGKPVITFGNVFYNFLDELVMHVHAYNEVPGLIRQFETFIGDESIVVDFLTAILDESINVDIQRLAGRLVSGPAERKQNDPELLQYADYLIQKIEALCHPTPVNVG